MDTQRINFPSRLKENEISYFRFLEGSVSSIDPDCSMQMTYKIGGVGVRISPTHPGRFNLILNEIKKSHEQLGIKVEFSKSMKAGSNIAFDINF
jgi:hypothetical protein